MRRTLFGLVSLAIVGCGGRQEMAAPETATRSAPSGATAPYEVHEWGLLRAIPGDALEAGAIAPPGFVEALSVDKPVLYFHASAPVQLERVHVEAVGGTIREHWPMTSAATGAPFPAAIDWTGLSLDAAQSAGGARCAGAFPGLAAPPCSALPPGEGCESAQLATAVSPSATCLQSGDTQLTFLFYRSRTATFTPPLRVTALPSGELRVTNTGALPIPGWVLRLRRNGSQVRAIAVRGPGARATVMIGDDFANAAIPTPAVDGDHGASDESDRMVDEPAMPGSQEPGRVALRLTLRELGLDDGEADAFLRAWDDTLFGGSVVQLVDIPPAPRDGTRPRDGAPRDGVPASDGRTVDVLSADCRGDCMGAQSDTILYFLPEQTCDGVARLSFQPAPTRVRRALAIWQLAR